MGKRQSSVQLLCSSRTNQMFQTQQNISDIKCSQPCLDSVLTKKNYPAHYMSYLAPHLKKLVIPRHPP